MFSVLGPPSLVGRVGGAVPTAGAGEAVKSKVSKRQEKYATSGQNLAHVLEVHSGYRQHVVVTVMYNVAS